MVIKGAARVDDFLPFALPDIGQDEIDEVVDALKSGWITTGPKTRRFEKDFATVLGGQVDAVAVNSATAGLHLAVEAVGLGRDDQVITCTHTFTATAEVVRYMGADPVFVDIDPQTWCLSTDEVAEAIHERTKAILPVHYGGYPCDMDGLGRIAGKSGCHVIEDAAHAFPTRYRGRLIGSLDSAATVFSFYATKTIATGEGGMLVTRDPAIARRARIMRLHGIDRDAFDRFRSARPSWYYEVVAPGYKYNMTDVAAALGIHQLRRSHGFHRRRLVLAARYDAELSDLPVHLPPRPSEAADHAWHLYVIRLADDARSSRDEMIGRMHAQGIGCSVHYVPLHLQPYWRDRYSLRPDRFPHSQRLYERSISLPIYTRMSDDDQTRVIAAFRRAVLG
jgi:dTDP-4-amino-4,6-dideoxygalactose transaminase